MPSAPPPPARAPSSAVRARARAPHRRRGLSRAAPSAPGDPDDARVAGEIVDHARFSAERVLEKVRDLFRERRVDLEECRPVRSEHAIEVRRGPPDEVKAIL